MFNYKLIKRKFNVIMLIYDEQSYNFLAGEMSNITGLKIQARSLPGLKLSSKHLLSLQLLLFSEIPIIPQENRSLRV